MLSPSGKRLLIVSNRLPVNISGAEDDWTIHPSSGGLITALEPLVRRCRGTWLGWPGCSSEAPLSGLLREFSDRQEYTLKPVVISEEEIEKYYLGFSNRTIWPLFHDLLGHCTFNSEHWEYYQRVNERFAREIAKLIDGDDFVWIHDYQLMLVGHFLRGMGVDVRLNFFLHIPFPSCDLLKRLPWRQEIMHSLLEYDHVGFQTTNDRRNFIQCLKRLAPEAPVKKYKRKAEVLVEGRTVRLGTYPISIDYNEFNDFAGSNDVADAAWYIHENLPDLRLMLGIDRLDYTKGIPERFLAFERALEKYPDLRGKMALVQIVVPSRLHVPEYQHLKGELDALSGRINARFSSQGWVPIHYMFRELSRTQLLGYYRACEIAIITPLRDGMNLVSKEYCASSIDNNGILILSEFAGAADQLSKGALMVNPYDCEVTADAIYAAFIMEPEERQRRMKTLRAEVRRNNVQRWIEWFMESDTVGHEAVDEQAESPAEQPVSHTR
ncbi:MAG: trehalose-6-phosphate synthase [candidate division Zixibacteria bacterium]|nr:trehalose-6-phosphate synthase [candidate division Zixibacteria bacterium]